MIITILVQEKDEKIQEFKDEEQTKDQTLSTLAKEVKELKKKYDKL